MNAIFKALAAFALLFIAAPAAAGTAAGWRVTQMTGDAIVLRPGVQPASLKARSILNPGDTIATGASGRATLVRGADYIVVAPRSRMMVPAAQDASGFTRVVQQLGTLLFKVKHTGKPHFAVDTPMLAAVVKGTTFTVTVGERRSAVQVTEGLVEVLSSDGRDRELVAGGKAVFVDHDRPGDVVIAGPETLVPDNKAPTVDAVALGGSAGESLATIAEGSGGLFRAGSPATILAAPVAGIASAIRPVSAVAQNLVATGTETVNQVVAAPVETVVAIVADVTNVTVAAPAITTPELTTPAVTVPAVTVPAVTVPAVTVPAVTVPAVTVPAVTVPAVTVPVVTVPTVPAIPAIPAVTVPTIPALPTVPPPPFPGI